MQNSALDFIVENCFIFDFIKFGENYKNVSDEELKTYEKLTAILNKEQLNIFENFINFEIELKSISNETFFKEGMKLGMRLAIECLTD